MALSATFTANFSSFYDAVDKAESKLKDFGTGADKVGGRLNAMADQFSGRRIVQEATIMAKAVEDIGGTAFLTEKELKRLGATTNEAVDKMKRLGMEVPKNLEEIANKTKDANKSTSDWMGTFAKMGGIVAGAFSIGAITNFIGSVFEAADAVGDLANQWGFSMKAVQQWTGAAKQSGVEAQTVGKSVQFVTEKLSESSAEYKALLANIGLSDAALKKMPLEDAYKKILSALTDVKDETLQYDLALGLIGPSAKQMIGGIRDGLVAATDAQKVMSDETIKALKAAKAQWEEYKNWVVIYSADMVAAAISDTKTMTASWKNFFTTVGYFARDVFTGRNDAAKFLEDTGAAAAKVQAQTTAAIQGANKALNEQTRATIGADQAVEYYGASLAQAGVQMGGVTLGGIALGRSLKTTAQVTAEVNAREEARKKGLKDLADAQEKAKQKQDAYNKSVDDLVKTFSGGGLVEKAELYVKALKNSIPIQDMTTKQQTEINKVMWDAIVAYERAGQSAPKAMYDIYTATAKAAGAIKELQESLPTGDWIKPGSIDLGKALTLDPVPLENQFSKMQVELDKAFADMGATGGKALTETFSQSLGNLSAAFADLGQISGGAFGEATEDIATLIGAMNTASKSADTFKSGIMSFQGGNVAQGFAQTAAGAAGVITSFQTATKETGRLQSTLNGAAIGFSVAGPWGAAVGAAAGLIKGFINRAKEAREVRKMRDDFVVAAGGIDALRTAAEHAGLSVDKLLSAKKKGDLEAAVTSLQAALESENLRKAFIDAEGGVAALTKAAEMAGVTVDGLFAAKSTDEVKASIKDIEDALKFQADAYDLAIETAQRYGFTLEELGPAMAAQELDKKAQGLFKDWEVLNSAGIDTVLITEKMSKSVSEYVQQASKMGTEVPSAMRPMLEAMAKSGDLLDENGNAITDLEGSGLKFSMTMSEGFNKMIQEVARLTDAISRSLGLAIKNVPQPEIKGKVTWDVETPPTSHPQSGGDVPEFQHGTDGFRNFGKGTPVMLHGWEAVVPREASGAFATVSGAGGGAPAGAVAPTVIVNAQGAFFDTPDSLQRLANKVSDALTAKYSVMGKLRAAV